MGLAMQPFHLGFLFQHFIWGHEWAPKIIQKFVYKSYMRIFNRKG